MSNIGECILKLKTNIRTNRVLRVFVIVFIPAYIIDQLTKAIVVMTMSEYQAQTVLPWLQWRYLRNSGAAFSLGESFTLIYTAVMLLVAAGIFVLIRRVNNVSWGIGMALVAAGTTGNLTDRLLRQPGWGSGYVVDFISVGDFAVFNLADTSVCCGMALLCLLVVRGIPSGITLLSGATKEAKVDEVKFVKEAEVETAEELQEVPGFTYKSKVEETTHEFKTEDKIDSKAADEVVSAAEEIVGKVRESTGKTSTKSEATNGSVTGEEQSEHGDTENPKAEVAVDVSLQAKDNGDDKDKVMGPVETTPSEQAGETSH